MIARRSAVLGLIAGLLFSTSYASAGEIVAFAGYRPGSIVVRTNARELYFVLGDNRAIRYPVGVGKAGMAWSGHARVARKLRSPAWRPPDDIWRNSPWLPEVIPGGSPRNPMGVAVLGLDHGNYAIHGTNNPASIGHFVSHGCIRMSNADVRDLYARARLGTEVYVLP
jgi:lipoprotein-anchoring transpeptidase ErfK/SrfK